MVEQVKRSKEHWWNTFQKASFPAYASLVDPPSLRDINTDAAQVRVKCLLVDDVLDTGGYKKGSAPQQFEVAEGSFVLVLPSDAGSASAHCVSPPWLCRVNRIWLLPRGDAAGGGSSSSLKDVKGAQPEVQQWERRQIAAGRVAAQHFQLQVTYFYRWPDLADAIEGSAASSRSLARALTSLGVLQQERQLAGLLGKRGCGRTPPNHFGMRYVVFSNHETRDPGSDDDDDSEEQQGQAEAGDSPVPLESVMGPAQVLFLPSGAELPYQPAPPPAAAAAASAASTTSRRVEQLPHALRARLAAQRQQLLPGFVCNLFLAKAEAGGGAARLFELSGWAEGSAGAELAGRPWVAGSRRQVKQLLANTQQQLAAAGGQQQQPAGTPAAATATRATGAQAAAVAASVGDDEEQFVDDGEQFVDARSGSPHHSGEASADHDAAAAAGSRKRWRRREQQQQQPAAGSPAAIVGEDAAAAGKQQQQQQQHKRRRVVVLESEEDEDKEQQQQQQQQQQSLAALPGVRPAALLAAEQQGGEGEGADDDADDGDDDDDSAEDDQDSEEDEDGSEGRPGIEHIELLSSGTTSVEEGEVPVDEAEGELGAAAAAAAAAVVETAPPRPRGRPPKKQKLQQR